MRRKWLGQTTITVYAGTGRGVGSRAAATSIQDADGRLRDFVYNNDQQLTAENWMSGNTIIASMAYGYDLAGDLTSAGDANSAYAFAYNGDGQVTSVDNAGTPNVPHVVLASGYDLLGDRTSLSATIAGTADFANTYTYNESKSRHPAFDSALRDEPNGEQIKKANKANKRQTKTPTKGKQRHPYF